MQKITFIGLGKPGAAMATKLLQAGVQLTARDYDSGFTIKSERKSLERLQAARSHD